MIKMGGFWEENRVLVTGGGGFIGSHLVELLVRQGAKVRVADDFSRGSMNNLSSCLDQIEVEKTDLKDPSACRLVCRDIDVVLGLAGRVAGIQFNQSHSAEMFYSNSRISLNMLEAARQADAKRYLVVSSACVYRRACSIPTPEEEGFLDNPEPTNWGYGWAKRFAEIQGMAYASQYGMKVGIVRPYNAYGPRDYFALDEAHVIPSLIARVAEKTDPLVVWGSGKQTRSFIYAKDVASGMALAIEKHPSPDPINIGSDEEVEIRDLVEVICQAFKFRPRIVFDTTRPEGNQRRKPDVSKARTLLNFSSTTRLRRGIDETVGWFMNVHRRSNNLNAPLTR